MRIMIRDVAQRRGMTLSAFQRATLFPMSTCQRYWHGRSFSGNRHLQAIKLAHLDIICAALRCGIGDILQPELPSGTQSSEL